ncbi:MAG: hypothetical protein WBN92_09310 [Terriglobia bacterium]
MSQIDHTTQVGSPTENKARSIWFDVTTTGVSVAFMFVFTAMLMSPALAGRAGGQEGARAPAREGSHPQERMRFDNQVRELFFSGYAGDQASLDRGMKLCEDELAKNPKHSEAMVWHGAGLVFLSGQVFRKGDFKQGLAMRGRGLKEMDDAVALLPGSVEVLIPRGAVLLSSSRYVRDLEAAKAMLKKGVDDYEKALEIQGPIFLQLPLHSRGELLFGLAEGWHRLGNPEKARSYFTRTAEDAAGSGRDKQAQEFLDKGTLPEDTNCVGCHTQ